MTIDPVKIPQNVYIEDRIVGPLTLRQLLIIAIGGGFSYAIYSLIVKAVGNPGIVVTITAWIPCVVAAAFALIKVNDLSLMRICLLLIERTNKPPRRTYAPRRGISINVQFSDKSKDEKQQNMKKEVDAQTEAQEKIRKLSSVVDEAFPKALVNVPQAADDTDTAEEVAVRQTAHAEPDEQEHDVVDDADTRPVRVQEAYRPPVDKTRIATDPAATADPYQLKDLSASVFRDILPPSAQ